MYKKIIKIIFIVIIILQLIVFNGLPNVLAQESTPEPTVEPTPSETFTPTPNPTDIPSETPTPEPSITPTETETPAPTSTPTLQPDETPVPSDSPSEEPILTPTPAPTDLPIESATESAQLSSVAAESSSPPQSSTVAQSGSVSTNTSSQSSSGGNSQSGASSAAAVTGNTQAIANSVTVVNLSEVNSNLITSVQNILTSDNPDINLYDELLKAIANNPNFVPGNTDLFIIQEGEAVSQTSAESDSGGNTQTGGILNLTTGTAEAVANSLTAVNINLIGSNVVIAVINIFSDYNGNLILPSGLVLTPQNSNGGEVNVSVEQNAETVVSTTSVSSSGDNSQTASISSQMVTGNSLSLSNSLVISNLLQINGGLGYLIINNVGSWTGKIFNWQSPGSVQQLNGNTEILTSNWSGEDGTGGIPSNVTVFQNANVTSNTNASAITGQNSQEGASTSLATGNARSVANSAVFANITGVNSGMFLGIINIFGNWKGNIITAYPEITANLSDNMETINPGDHLNYEAVIENRGKAIAHGVKFKINLSDSLISDSALPTFWEVGDVFPGQILKFYFGGRIKNDSQPGTKVKTAIVAETTDIQSNSEYSSGSDETIVNALPHNSPDTRKPNLELSVWNNTGKYILPGDTILAKVTVINRSAFPAKNIKIRAAMGIDPNTKEFPLSWNVGNLRPNGRANISFNLKLDTKATPGVYNIISFAEAVTDSGDSYSTGQTLSSFIVKGNIANVTGTGNEKDPEVAGAFTEITEVPPQLPSTTHKRDINKFIPFLYLLIPTYLMIQILKRRIKGLPLVSPVFANFFKRKRVAFATGALTVIFVAIVLVKKYTY